MTKTKKNFKLNKKLKGYLLLLLAVFILSVSVGLAYKVGAMHSFFTVNVIYMGSELICTEASINNTNVQYIDGICFFGDPDGYCANMKGLPYTQFCKDEPYTWKDSYESFITTGRTLQPSKVASVTIKEPMVLIE